MLKRNYFLLLTFLLWLLIPLRVSAGPAENFGILDVKNHSINSLPKARGDGSSDDTNAISNLANYAYNNRMVLVFPQGTYLVSDTITLVQDHQYSQRQSHAYFLVGSTKGSTPVIKLKSNSSGFQNSNPANVKPVFRIEGHCNQADINKGKCVNTFSRTNDRASTFRNGIKNLVIDLNGNPGAVGISFEAAQNSSIENITINAQGAFAGFTDIPGLGAVTSDIVINGGQYGIYAGGENGNGDWIDGPALTNITFNNQTKSALYGGTTEKSFVMAGFYIKGGQTPIHLTSKAHVSLVDGYIDSTSNQVIKTSDSNQTISINNVLIKNPTNIVYANNSVPITGSDNLVDKFYYTSSNVRNQSFLIDNSFKSGKHIIQTSKKNTAEPEEYLKLHAMGLVFKSPDHLYELSKTKSEGVCNLGDYGATPENVINSAFTQALNDNQCKLLVLGTGDYLINNTVNLTKSFVGIAAHASVIQTADTWKPTSPTNMFTINNQNGKMYGYVWIRFNTSPANNDYFTAIYVKNTKAVFNNFDCSPLYSANYAATTLKHDVYVTGNNLIKWYGASTGSFGENDSTVNGLRRRFFIQDSTGAINIYDFNIEDGQMYYGDNTNGWQSEVLNSDNVAIFSSKFEDRSGFRIKNSNNVGYFGGSGRTEVASIGNSNIVITNLVAKRDFGTKLFYYDGGNINQDVYLVAYEKGNFNIENTRALTSDILNEDIIIPTPSENPTPNTTPTPNECICTKELNPVCGSNGVTYDNSCLAECDNVTYSPGACIDGFSKYDLNKDTKIDIVDIITLIRYVFGG